MNLNLGSFFGFRVTSDLGFRFIAFRAYSKEGIEYRPPGVR